MAGVTGKPILGCNLSCHGCYEGEIFAKGHPEKYDLAKFIEGVRQGPPGAFTMHGGEALLMPLPDLRTVFEAVRDMGRPIALQSNFTIVTERTLDLLQEFKVSVGVSLNGPWEMNADRSDTATTGRVHRNIRLARERGLDVGIITVLSKTNAGHWGKVQQLVEWAALWGEEHRVWDFRFNLMFGGGDKELDPQQASTVYQLLARATHDNPHRHWNPFREFVDNLFGLGLQPCWMSPCDPYHTDAVHAVLGQGEAANCLRTAHDGVAYLRAPDAQYVRQDILYQIPVEQGGCGGCRYWNVCHGGCPAEGVNGDWRNKTRWCRAIYDTYALIEDEVKGLLPNFVPVVDWQVSGPEAASRIDSRRGPSALPSIDPNLVERPSTYTREAARGITV